MILGDGLLVGWMSGVDDTVGDGWGDGDDTVGDRMIVGAGDCGSRTAGSGATRGDVVGIDVGSTIGVGSGVVKSVWGRISVSGCVAEGIVGSTRGNSLSGGSSGSGSGSGAGSGSSGGGDFFCRVGANGENSL